MCHGPNARTTAGCRCPLMVARFFRGTDPDHQSIEAPSTAPRIFGAGPCASHRSSAARCCWRAAPSRACPIRPFRPAMPNSWPSSRMPSSIRTSPAMRSPIRPGNRPARSCRDEGTAALPRVAGRQGDPLRRVGGRRAYGWTGTARIDRKAEWPAWNPPAEMIKRWPHVHAMQGGPMNPLAPAPCTCRITAGTRSTGSTAPTSPRRSGRRSPPGASGCATSTWSTSTTGSPSGPRSSSGNATGQRPNKPACSGGVYLNFRSDLAINLWKGSGPVS